MYWICECIGICIEYVKTTAFIRILAYSLYLWSRIYYIYHIPLFVILHIDNISTHVFNSHIQELIHNMWVEWSLIDRGSIPLPFMNFNIYLIPCFDIESYSLIYHFHTDLSYLSDFNRYFHICHITVSSHLRTYLSYSHLHVKTFITFIVSMH